MKNRRWRKLVCEDEVFLCDGKSQISYTTKCDIRGMYEVTWDFYEYLDHYKFDNFNNMKSFVKILKEEAKKIKE